MSLAEKVREKLRSFRDPVTGLSIVESQAMLSIREVEDGVIQIEFVPSSPYNPMAYSYAIALKTISSKVEGVKKVVVLCKNHIMAERINEEVNRKERD